MHIIVDNELNEISELCGSQAADMLTDATSSALLSLRILNPYVVGTIKAGDKTGPSMPRQDTQAVTDTTVRHGCQPVMGISSFAFQVPIR